MNYKEGYGVPATPRRYVEVRLLVIAVVDLTSPQLADALKADAKEPSSVAQVVSQEVISNLESVPYVDTAIVSYL